MKLSAQLLAEQAAISAEIDAAFANVTRSGGVSWSQTWVIDNYGTQAELDEAAKADTDHHWSELVSRKDWDDRCGVGGWSFLDPIGFRYYLPAAMKRALIDGHCEHLTYLLTYSGDKFNNWKRAKGALLGDRQRRCIARFIRFKIDTLLANDFAFDAELWQRAYDSCWQQFDNQP